MDNQINFIIPENEFQNGKLKLSAESQIINFDSGFDTVEQNNCEKCNFHEATYFDKSFGNICSKCFEWLSKI